MASSELVDLQRSEGEALLRALDRTQLPVSSAFWYRLPESEEWRLIIASPAVRERGPDYGLQQIQKALRTLPSSRIRLTDILLVKDSEPVVQAIATSVKTQPTEIGGIDFNSCSTASGVFISGAHVYRSTST